MVNYRFLIACQLSVFCITAQSQVDEPNYRPFAQEGKTWETQVGRIMENNYVNTIDGDTLINGETWKKVYNYVAFPTAEYSYYAAIRDVGQKVYAIAKGSTRPRLLYDFSLQVGDMVKCGIEGNVFGCLLDKGESLDSLLGYPFKAYLKVESIDVIEARGSRFRRFTLSLLDAYREFFWNGDELEIGNVIWIEGIGSGAGPFSPWMPLPPRGRSVQSCEIGQACIFGNLDFYDNPGTNVIRNIQSYKKIGTIYDLQGRRLMKAPEKGLYIQDRQKRVKN